MNVHSRAIIAILLPASEIREICEEQLATHVYTLSNHTCIQRQKTIRNMQSNKELSELRSKFRTLNEELNLANKRCNKTSNLERCYNACEPHCNKITSFSSLSPYKDAVGRLLSLFIIVVPLSRVGKLEQFKPRKHAVAHAKIRVWLSFPKISHDGDVFTTPSRTTTALSDTILYHWDPLAADDVSRKHSTTLECRPRGNNKVNDVTLPGFR